MADGKISYDELTAGYEFPPASFQIEETNIAAYLAAVGDTNSLYRDIKAIPPTAAIAFAMTALSRGLTLPGGAIHISQDMEFLALIRPGETITSKSKVSRNQKRGQMHMLGISLQLYNQENKLVAAGSTDFILPQPGETGR